MIYNPQGLIHKEYVHKQNAPMSAKPNGYIKNRPNHKAEYEVKFINYPVSVLHFSNPNNDIQHPTQKPVALFEYLIKTYTNEGDAVLDSCIGSGTTAIAALNTGRHFIGIENEPKYVEIARKRISALPKKLTDFAYK
jgi:site-specific DNA-methyltransferase (adenine-specific)